jgi:copper chaperone NosL
MVVIRLYPYFLNPVAMNEENKIKGLSKSLLILAALLLASNIILPIWQIELWAPQYPEGLVLLIYADKLAGSVDIINGLNHYIGMHTLHTEDFVEFSLLRYIFGFISLCIIAVALIGRKKPVYILFIFFLLFAVLAMADFYRWNYNYGHHLDPNAAIKVPGMAYQPPLIGYKKLLNFGAYSVPASGGIMFIASGLLILFVLLFERGVFKRIFKRKTAVATILLFVGTTSFYSCSAPGPKPIKLNQDHCAFCQMTLTDPHYATQLVTSHGRQYVFDDIICMLQYRNENPQQKYLQFYIADFTQPEDFIDMDHAILITSDSLHSPMGGNTIGFALRDSAQGYISRLQARELQWETLKKE